MNCREFTEFLDDYLFGDLPEDERAVFEEHLAQCPDCEAYLESYRRTIALEKAALDDETRDALAAAMPEELVQAILEARPLVR